MRLFLLSLRRHLSLIWQALTSPFIDRRRPGGTLLVLFALPVFLVWQLLHGLGWLLDEILFRGYRKVDVKEPLFVLGPPRSGTTHLHHVLAMDDNTTTFRAWECLFGLSVCGRKLCLGLMRLDKLIGRPVGRLIDWAGVRLLKSMDDIHPLALDAPEEDFLCLTPVAACFLLIVPFPRSSWLWRVARFDTALPDKEKRALMAYYRACIQKHLYTFGPDKQFLSKNASFTGMAQALLDEFPDARIFATSRDPMATVPSQLSSLQPAMALCGFPKISETMRDELTNLLRFYYEHLADVVAANPGRIAIIENSRLRDSLAESVKEAADRTGLALRSTFIEKLEAMSNESRKHRSGHKYRLEDFALSDELIRSKFATVYARYEFP